MIIKHNKRTGESKFVNKKGYLTRYSFACGYIEQWDSVERMEYKVYIATPNFIATIPVVEIKLYLDSPTWNVRITNHKTDIADCRHVWGCFETYKDARKFVSNKIWEYHNS